MTDGQPGTKSATCTLILSAGTPVRPTLTDAIKFSACLEKTPSLPCVWSSSASPLILSGVRSVLWLVSRASQTVTLFDIAWPVEARRNNCPGFACRIQEQRGGPMPSRPRCRHRVRTSIAACFWDARQIQRTAPSALTITAVGAPPTRLTTTAMKASNFTPLQWQRGVTLRERTPGRPRGSSS